MVAELVADLELTNDDLRPTRPEERTMTGCEMASLWVGMVVGVPCYYLAGSMVELGMSWWQGILTVALANSIILFPLTLTGHAGARYGISFPVLARAAFGIRGAHIATLARALIACGWSGIETWIGGLAIFLLLPSSLKPTNLTKTIPWLGTSTLELVCFFVFWVIQAIILWKGMNGVRRLQSYASPVLVFYLALLLGWAYIKAGGFGAMLAYESRLSRDRFPRVFFTCLTASASSWCGMSINIPDFTRFAKSQTDQVLGQAGLPIFMSSFAFVGLAVTSSTSVIFGETISNPIVLLSKISTSVPVILLCVIGISLATLTTNLAANMVAPATAIVNFCPGRVGFTGGAMVICVIGVLFQPWRLFQSSETYVSTWLVGYSALIGPIGGIILTDYWVLRRGFVDVHSLYSARPYGPYWYCGGINPAAVVALIVALLPVIPGFLQEVGIVKGVPDAFAVVYDVSWFATFLSAGFLYWVLSVCISKLGIWRKGSELSEPFTNQCRSFDGSHRSVHTAPRC